MFLGARIAPMDNRMDGSSALQTTEIALTLTLTLSDEATNKCQKPGPTDMSDGVMTP